MSTRAGPPGRTPLWSCSRELSRSRPRRGRFRSRPSPRTRTSRLSRTAPCPTRPWSGPSPAIFCTMAWTPCQRLVHGPRFVWGSLQRLRGTWEPDRLQRHGARSPPRSRSHRRPACRGIRTGSRSPRASPSTRTTTRSRPFASASCPVEPIPSRPCSGLRTSRSPIGAVRSDGTRARSRRTRIPWRTPSTPSRSPARGRPTGSGSPTTTTTSSPSAGRTRTPR